LDDINDFNSDAIVNDDSSVMQKIAMLEEGNVTDEARGKEVNKAYKQGNKQGYGGYDDDGFYGYGYKGTTLSTFIIVTTNCFKKDSKFYQILLHFYFSKHAVVKPNYTIPH
jgi:hypothetical protein